MSKSGPDKVIDFRSFGERPAKGLATSLYIGSKADAKAEKTLRERGVKFVLNCTPTRNLDPEAGCPNFFEGRSPPPFSYKRIPIFDNRGEDILQYMEGAVSFIEQSKHYGSVLVHCNKGISRSASFVIGYLMKTGGLRLEEALAFLKEKRGIVQPNDSFMAQLQTYDARLEAQRAEARAKHERIYGSSSSSSSSAAASAAARPAAAGAATAGPIGPALPPHLLKKGPQPQLQEEGNGAPKASAKSATIGPAMPPHLQKGAPEASRAIGPAMPPHLQKKPEPAPAAAAPIGPSLPPPAPAEAAEAGKGRDEVKKKDEDGQVANKKRPAIGPTLPPGMGRASEGKDDGAGKRAKV